MEKENKNNFILIENFVNIFDIYIFLIKFKKHLQREGKLLKYNNIIQNVFILLKKKNLNPLLIIKSIIINLKPYIGLKITRFGRRKIIYPILLKKKKAYFYIYSWLLQSIKVRTELLLEERIVNEFIDIYNNKGLSINKYNNFNLNIIEAKPYLWRKYTKNKKYVKLKLKKKNFFNNTSKNFKNKFNKNYKYKNNNNYNYKYKKFNKKRNNVKNYKKKND